MNGTRETSRCNTHRNSVCPDVCYVSFEIFVPKDDSVVATRFSTPGVSAL